MKIREGCSELRREFEELKSQCGSTMDGELKELDEEIQQGDIKIQELMNDRVRLREKSSMAGAEVKKLEEGIKKDFLDRKTVVIKQDELDKIERLGDHR